MRTIANNISSKKVKVARALSQGDADFIREMARQCLSAGADVLDINLQHGLDRPRTMEVAVQAAQEAGDAQLCLSSNNVLALEAGLRKCRRSALVNYVSLEEDRVQKILPVAAKYGAGVVLLPSGSSPATGAEEVIRAASILVGAANELGITNDRILIDPGVFHITALEGQHHAQVLMELLPALTSAFDPGVEITCWVENISSGIPARLRPPLNRAFFMMLAGLGLSSVFVDILDRDTRRTMRLAKILKGELVYSDRDIEL